MGAIGFYLLMLQKYIKNTRKKKSIAFRNISGDFSANNMKKSRIKWVYVRFFY